MSGRLHVFLVGLLSLTFLQLVVGVTYEPNWESLDSRPLPPWYDEAKFGVFMHWGVYSVPSFGSEWFWYNWKGVKNRNNESYVNFMKENYPPNFDYADFAPMFRAEAFDPNQWADILKASGAKYYVLTSKHHEGFTLWPSERSWNWNAKDVGPHKDLVGDLANAIRRRTNIRFGLYHSLFEWFHPLYLKDKAGRFATDDFVRSKSLPELYDIVNKYEPDVIWSDGDWEAPASYWNSTEFLAWLYNDSPVKDTVVTNDRWGSGVACKHGGYLTCTDGFNPGVLQERKFENAMTVSSGSWGYVRSKQINAYKTPESLIASLAKTVSCNGNMLLNVGPTADGRIEPVFEERLRQMGQWLGVNGAAIYGTKPWSHQNDTINPQVWYTSRAENDTTLVYAIVLKWPGLKLTLGAPAPSENTKVVLLGNSEELQWTSHPQGGIDVDVPAIPVDKMPCLWAWAFRFENLTNPPDPPTFSKKIHTTP